MSRPDDIRSGSPFSEGATSGGMSRRRMIGATAVGGAAMWTAPAVTSWASASAQTSPPVTSPLTHTVETSCGVLTNATPFGYHEEGPRLFTSFQRACVHPAEAGVPVLYEGFVNGTTPIGRFPIRALTGDDGCVEEGISISFHHGAAEGGVFVVLRATNENTNEAVDLTVYAVNPSQCQPSSSEPPASSTASVASSSHRRRSTASATRLVKVRHS